MHSFYQDHHPWLQNLLRKQLSNRDDAADLAQDTFMRLLRAPVPQEEIRDPRRYLATIARGLVTDLFRRRSLERSYLEYLATLPQALAPSCEEQLIVQQALLEADRLLQGLPAKVREAFILAQYEELSYPEIAQRLGISLRTVSNYLARALEHCCLAMA